MVKFNVCPLAQRFSGQISVPGDKSISHRALMLGMISKGEMSIEGLSMCEDVIHTKQACVDLGIDIQTDGNKTYVRGHGLYGVIAADKRIDCGNSGTSLRLFAGLLSGQSKSLTLVGDESLHRRPMKRILDPLQTMGANIEGRVDGEEIYPPLHIQSTNKLSHIDYTLPVASAQVKSALLFASLYAQQDSLIVEPILSRDHTERMLCYLGAPVLFQKTPGTIVMQVSSWNRELLPKPISIPGDISSAAFIIAAAVITQSSVTISNVGLNPLRKCFLDALRKSGACIEEEIVSQENMEPRGNIVVHQNKNRQPFVLNRQEVASCIDEIPILAIVAACSSGESQFYGVEDLEFKESNRIKTIQDMLSSFSVSSKYHDGILSIDGIGEQLFSKATIQTQGDHRIVMAAAIASLRANGVCTITHADSVDTSFPSFALTLQKLGVEIQAH